MRVFGRAPLVGAGLTAAAVLGACLTGCGTTDDAADGPLHTAFAEAAQESGVPQDILLALSYNLTNWKFEPGKPNLGGGYGPMGLIDTAPGLRGLGKGDTAKASAVVGDAGATVSMAARAASTTNDVVRTDSAQNIRAAALLLASDARATSGGALPRDEAGWYAALASYAHAPSPQGANAFADDVFETLHDGVTARASTGETLTVPAIRICTRRPRRSPGPWSLQ